MQKSSFISVQNKDQQKSDNFFHKKKQSSFFSATIQPKLTINQPNDIYEQEADTMADKVMRVPESVASNNFFFKPGISSIQRKCAHCVQEEKLQRKETNNDFTVSSTQTEDYINSLSGGRTLNQNERHFFEPRMGYDFSDVKIHTDSEAAKSAQSINALAYTTGKNIVFNERKFSPDTDSGKRLLGHELTHVVQQNGIGTKLQKKETYSSVAAANRGSVAPQDWLDLDRQDWEMASQGGYEASVSPTNTFIRAVYYNTRNLLPSEYTSIRQRHDYYDVISYVIQYDPNTPAAVRGVRFFDAANMVTGSPGIGTVDTPAGAIMLLSQSRVILREVNAELFAKNMGIINNLLFNWQEPRSPANPQGQISAFDFDIMMVDAEQNQVEGYINTNRARFTPAVISDINNTLDPSAFGQYFNPTQTAFQWAISALNVSKLDFTIREHRVAIGRAEVHIFHRLSKSDYLAYMHQHPIPPILPPLSTGTQATVHH